MIDKTKLIRALAEGYTAAWCSQNAASGATLGRPKTTYNDDIITGWVGVGSQIDGFGHAGIDSLYFNCNKAADFTMPDGLKKLGIENVPAVATRGVLLDMAGYVEL